MTYDLDPNVMRVRVTATINYLAQMQKNSQPVTFRDAFHLDSAVDLTKEPNVYVPKQR